MVPHIISGTVGVELRVCL